MATKKREKKIVVSGVTREDADAAFAQYAKSNAQIDKITADIELQVARIREKYAPQLGVLEKERDEAFEKLQSFAMEHKEELFVRKKSLEMLHGVIGFRTGTPKLKTAKGFTWASVLVLVKDKLSKYIRTTEEIAKDRLLADREEEGLVEKMAEVGILVAQDETFYVEPKSEESAG